MAESYLHILLFCFGLFVCLFFKSLLAKFLINEVNIFAAIILIKLRTFRKFKLTHDYENYLTNVRNINHRVAITKLRLSNHKLAIETGRYVKPYQSPDQRICPLCKTGLEDEEHFLMNCIAYRDPSRELCSIR